MESTRCKGTECFLDLNKSKIRIVLIGVTHFFRCPLIPYNLESSVVIFYLNWTFSLLDLEEQEGSM
jgi:hypothetical protein